MNFIFEKQKTDNKLFDEAESAKAKTREQSIETEKLKQENIQLQVKVDSK